MDLNSILILAIGIIVGCVATWLVVREKIGATGAAARAELAPPLATVSAALAAAEANIGRLEQEKVSTQRIVDQLASDRDAFGQAKIQAETNLVAEGERTADLGRRLTALTNEYNLLRAERDGLATAKAELDIQLQSDRASFAEKLTLLDDAKQAMSNQFKVLADQILEDKSVRFTKLNQERLDAILTPLGQKLKDFESKVQTVYDNETQQRTALKTEITKLVEANARIGTDANNLARALKGEAKTQGAWGEMILERLLEMSGLTRDREYRVQQTFVDDEGGRLRPDVIVDLPEQKHVLIDSKVSLTAYERSFSTENDAERLQHSAQHVASVRAHVAGLAQKDYQGIYDLKTLDFVLMFVPIESAFFAAVQADPAMFQDAMKKNVMIVCPSTLLGTLRIIAHIWRYEYQNRNAQEIARQAAALYDKFVGFVADLREIGDRLERARNAYDAAFNKLVDGRGNLIRSTERLRELGVRPSKSIPESLVEIADDVSIAEPQPVPIIEDQPTSVDQSTDIDLTHE